MARVKTAHARLVRAAERKLQDFGIPTEELGFLPQVVASGGGGALRAAAGGGLLANSNRGSGRRGGTGKMGGHQRASHHVSVTQATVKI